MITFQTYFTEEECKKFWNKYSDNKYIWDLWDFRYPFHTDDFEFNFIVVYDEDEEIAVLPLVFDRKTKIYTYFGDTFPERNRILVSHEDYRDYNYDLYYACPYNTSLYYIDKVEEETFEEFSRGEKRYFLNLKPYKEFNDYLKRFQKNTEKTLGMI